jgi:hypothetical protein
MDNLIGRKIQDNDNRGWKRVGTIVGIGGPSSTQNGGDSHVIVKWAGGTITRIKRSMVFDDGKTRTRGYRFIEEVPR